MTQPRNRMFLSLAIVTVLTILIIPATGSASAQGGPPVRVNRDRVRVGDVIATGVRNADGLCVFDAIEVITETNPGGQGKFLATEANEDCELVVIGKWNGHLQDGPLDIVDPILNGSEGETVEATESEGSQSRSGSGASRNSSSVPTLSNHQTRTSEYVNWTYGYGGTSNGGDELTSLYARLRYSYDFSTVWQEESYGSCWRETWTIPYGWEWTMDSCWKWTESSPSYVTVKKFEGGFHCSDLPGGLNPCGGSTGYYHWLGVRIEGWFDGHSRCGSWISGSWVLGPATRVIQGCY